MLALYILPVAIWAQVMAGIGYWCWGFQRLEPSSGLYLAFNTYGYALKTVAQIMTLDSWTAIVNDFTYEVGFTDEYGPDRDFGVCSAVYGIAWCYVVAFIFGILVSCRLSRPHALRAAPSPCPCPLAACHLPNAVCRLPPARWMGV